MKTTSLLCVVISICVVENGMYWSVAGFPLSNLLKEYTGQCMPFQYACKICVSNNGTWDHANYVCDCNGSGNRGSYCEISGNNQCGALDWKCKLCLDNGGTWDPNRNEKCDCGDTGHSGGLCELNGENPCEYNELWCQECEKNGGTWHRMSDSCQCNPGHSGRLCDIEEGHPCYNARYEYWCKTCIENNGTYTESGRNFNCDCNGANDGGVTRGRLCAKPTPAAQPAKEYPAATEENR